MARFIFAFVLSVVSVAALGAETIDLGPSDWRKWDPRTSHHTLEGLRTSYGQPVRMGPSGGSLNVTRNPVVPYGAIGNGLKGLARSTPGAIAASAAMSGLFYGMDWLFEEGAWVKPGQIPVDIEGSTVWVVSGMPASTSGNTPAEACVNAYGDLYGDDQIGLEYWFDGNRWQCKAIGTQGSSTSRMILTSRNCPSGSNYVPAEGVCVRPGFIPLTDSDFADLTDKLPTLSPEPVGEAAGDVMNRQGAPLPGFSDSDITGPSSVTGPSTTTTSTGPSGTETAISTTTTNISYGPTTITTTTTTTTNNYTNGEPSGTTTTTETPSPDLVTEPPPSPGGSTSLDIPTDCEFMPTVCAFLDWFKEPMPMPEPDLPVVVDRDFERDYEMNLIAECPPPYTVETQLFGSLSISWQPFCDLATLIKPLVVGSAFLLSAFITLGIGRGKG